MQEQKRSYRFNLKNWMTSLSINNRSIVMDKIIRKSGQSKATIKRITYMSSENQTYVRLETKEAICKVFGRTMEEFENKNERNV